MKKLLVAGSALAMLAVTTAAAYAQSAEPRMAPNAGRIAVSPFAGTDFTVGGSVTKATSATTVAAGTVGGITFGAVGTLTFESKKFSDVYERPIDVGVGVSYGLSNSGEIFGSVRYLHATAKRANVGTISVAGTVGGVAFAAGADLAAKPDDFSSSALDVGYRHFFNSGSKLLPYAGASVGVNYTSAIDVETFVGESSAGKSKFYNSSLSPAAGLQIGVTYQAAPQVALGFETGLRYDGRLKGNDRDLGSALGSVNDAGDRISIPVRLTGRIVF